MTMDKKALTKLMGNRLTAAALREAGATRVPVTPKYELAEEVFKRFIAAGEPTGDFFEDHLLVSPEDWEKRQRARPVKVSYDPISGEALDEATATAWANLAPFTVLGGGVVSAADLAAYAKVEGLLSAEVTSTIARLVFPTGLTPVSPPQALAKAAQRWPYDPDAQDKATNRRRGLGAHSAKSAMVEPQPSQVVLNHGTIGQQINVPAGASLAFGSGGGQTMSAPHAPFKSREGQLNELLLDMFTADELRGFLRYLPGGGALVGRLPEGTASRALLVSEACQLLDRNNLLNRDFFDRLQLERPRRAHEILRLRDLYGV